MLECLWGPAIGIARDSDLRAACSRHDSFLGMASATCDLRVGGQDWGNTAKLACLFQVAPLVSLLQLWFLPVAEIAEVMSLEMGLLGLPYFITPPPHGEVILVCSHGHPRQICVLQGSHVYPQARTLKGSFLVVLVLLSS